MKPCSECKRRATALAYWNSFVQEQEIILRANKRVEKKVDGLKGPFIQEELIKQGLEQINLAKLTMKHHINNCRA